MELGEPPKTTNQKSESKQLNRFKTIEKEQER